MKPYDCDYSWEDVKIATNKLLARTLDIDGDIVGNNYNNSLPRAMDDVAKQVFMFGDKTYEGLSKELTLVRKGLVQIHTVGYVGKIEE
jgi:hypothetical protein